MHLRGWHPRRRHLLYCWVERPYPTPAVAATAPYATFEFSGVGLGDKTGPKLFWYYDRAVRSWFVTFINTFADESAGQYPVSLGAFTSLNEVQKGRKPVNSGGDAGAVIDVGAVAVAVAFAFEKI